MSPVLGVLLAACQAPPPSSWESDIAKGMVQLANQSKLSSSEQVEAALQLRRGSISEDEGRGNYRAQEPEERIESVRIDSRPRPLFPDWQSIDISFAANTCMTADIVRTASGVASEPFFDDSPPLHGAPRGPSPYVHRFELKGEKGGETSVIYLGYRRGGCFEFAHVEKFGPLRR